MSETPKAAFVDLIGYHLEKRAELARSIILDEIKDGDFSRVNEDDKISMYYRFMQSTMNGSARVNLRLLAKAINGLLNGEILKEGLYAEKFNRYAQMLETLTYEEIQVLAMLYVCKCKFGNNLMERSKSYYKAQAELENQNILNVEEFRATGDALLRTGLIYNKECELGSGTYYELSPFFYEVVKLVDFQDALNKESNL